MPLPTHRRRPAARSAAFGSAAALACTVTLSATLALAAPATAQIVTDPVEQSAGSAALSLSAVGTFETGVFDESAAEIVQAFGDRLFVVNAQAGAVTVLDYSDPTALTELFEIRSEGIANSVAIRADGLGVIALESTTKTEPGSVVFFDADAADAASAVLGSVTVGALPDMVTISADGTYAVVANEGEPADDFSVDPEGSIAVIALPGTVSAAPQDAVRIADFHAFEAGGALADTVTTGLPNGVRVFGPTVGEGFPVSRNLEPEYITVVGGTAYATLQEANSIAVVDLASATVTGIEPLGVKDYGTVALDPSDRDSGFSLRTYDDLYGIYMPDAISSYTAGGTTYLVTANEGDAREWGDYADVVRTKDLADDGYGDVCADSPLASNLGDADLGRLNVSREDGWNEDAGCYDALYTYGGRSFSIWTTSGDLVWDSGSSFEEITDAAAPEFVNSNHSESNLEGRSDDKGPEPEAIAIGELSGRTYAFVGFERVGGVAVYDVTDPASVSFVTYVNNRDFSVSVEDGGDLAQAGDLGPESIAFIAAADSPTGEPLLAVGNEVSGTTTVFAIDDALAPATTDIQVLTVNDFHGRIEQNLGSGEAGAAVIAGAVDAYEAENPNTLFVSSGDNIGAATFTSFIQDDEPTIDALVAAGLDLGAVGNHEFDQGFADLTDRVLPRYGSADYGLGANVYDRATGEPALPEYAIETVDGVRVAFIGTVTEQTAAMVSPTGIADITFGDQLEAANRVAAELSAGDLADVIVLLAHDGSAGSDCAALATEDTAYGELVRGASDEIDAIVSGHTHQSYACEVDGRPVIQAHQYGTSLGALEISVDAGTRELVSITGSVVPLVVDGQPAFDADPAVAEIVADAVEIAEAEGAVEVGAISADILRGGEAGADRGVESSLGNLVADMYLWAASNDDYAGTAAQIGLMNPGGLRADLLYGESGVMTYRDVANVQPFANTLVTVTLTGAQLKAVLEEQWQPEGSSRPKLHLGVSEGFAYEYDPSAAAGSRIVSMTLNGAAIEDAGEYTVVTNSFLAAGGDNFVTFADGTDRADTGQVDLSASVAYFAAHDVVDPAPLGRAVVVGEGSEGEEPGEGSEGEEPGEGSEGEEPGAGDKWATVDVGDGRVEQGGSLAVAVAGLTAGQQITATLHSDPIVVSGIPAASADGTVSFTVAIPADFELGAHTLVIESAGFDPISVDVQVVAAGGLAVTGGQFPIGFVTVLALGVVAAGAVLRLRRRSPATTAA